ncbi:MAG: hypothetical protein COX77_01850 [Candidatus Komeilibacteria bacterium CG_4_10_14_0_2_um_filter_37_10]|uniref:CDP-alcohol phosphatidyltransferase family protein n=1 Tax=Candidatus Komeilibacteria bacterium CG_4_10_14_0_2_um_filter_37_10 TaxID=1974470 RepID=A0A2M7VFF0_9BACT|nr:MAG: hypothetical protein COX77_01850 [Candidatus Komeilibacteria bacterium CG_4_10_14_0_2_um_filter_37_10]
MLLDNFKLYLQLRDRKDQCFWPLVQITPSWLSPNLITGLRFFLTFIIWWLWFLYTDPYFVQPKWFWLATIILIGLGSFTDFWDGALARLKNKITIFGEYFDPLVDKWFSLPAFFIFAYWWPYLSAIYWIVDLRVFLMLLIVIKALFRKNERYNFLLQRCYIIFSFIAYLIIVINLGWQLFTHFNL